MLKTKTILIYALAIFALALSACSKKSDTKEPDLGHYQEFAVSTLKKANAENWSSKCDTNYEKYILAITKKVDGHAGEISQFLSERRNSESDSGKIIGGLFVADNSKNTTSENWETEEFSWKNAIEGAGKAKTPYEWAKVGNLVNRLLYEDKKRTVYGQNFALVPEEFSIYETAYEITKACVQSKDCTVSSFSEEVAEVIGYYWWHKQLFRKMNTSDRKIVNMNAEKLRRSLKLYAERFHLEPYLEVKRVSPTLIEVPVDPGPFDKDKDRIAELLEKKWKSEKLSIKVRWTTRKKEPNCYLITFDPTKSYAASVWTDSKTIKLSAAVSGNTLTHEFGHVLGFKDHYYTAYYYGDSCSYKFHYKPSDVMSDHDGQVTKVEWEALDRAYPVDGRTWEKDERLPIPAP